MTEPLRKPRTPCGPELVVPHALHDALVYIRSNGFHQDLHARNGRRAYRNYLETRDVADRAPVWRVADLFHNVVGTHPNPEAITRFADHYASLPDYEDLASPVAAWVQRTLANCGWTVEDLTRYSSKATHHDQ